MMTENEGAALCGHERIDSLQREGYRIIQNPECFCFGMDAVLLAAYAKAGAGERVLDMGTGNAVIPLLMHARNHISSSGAHYTGLEIQEKSADLARRNVDLNGLNEDISIVQGDIKEASALFGGASFHVVTSNPPYIDENHGLVNPNSAKAVARHEILCTLEDVVREASKCLRDKGRFYMVHRPRRLVQIFECMRRFRLEPKRMRMVYPAKDKNANMVLLEAVRGGNAQLTVEKPLIICKESGEYTDEVRLLYDGMQGSIGREGSL